MLIDYVRTKGKKSLPKSKSKTKASASPPEATSPPEFTSSLFAALNSSDTAQTINGWPNSLPVPATTHQVSQPKAQPILLPTTGREASNSSSVPSSASPPNSRSPSNPRQYQSFGGRRRAPIHNVDRNSLPQFQNGHSLYSRHIPLPHEDQAHFYPGGLPDLDSLVPKQETGLSPGEKGCHVGFDTLASSGHGPSVSLDNVLVVGEERAVRIYRVSKKAVDILGHLDGLRGAIIGAKVLPWTFRSDSAAHGRPYIALVIHGPVVQEDEEVASSDVSAAPSTEDNDNSSDSSTTKARPGYSIDSRDSIRYYQTTVEIYSLSQSQHVATIFKCPPVKVDYNRVGEIKIPPPSGELQIDAKGKFLVVASGASGEIFIFSYFPQGPRQDFPESIRCIGKLWTTVQRRGNGSLANSSNGNEPPPVEGQDPRKSALFSLSHRWVAVVPPVAESAFTMKGIASLASVDSRPPGIRSHVPAIKPVTNCGLDTPETDTLIDRVSREVTQQVLKGAQWAAGQSLQAWNNYWRPSPQQHDRSNADYHALNDNGPAFPPTHALPQSPPSSTSSPVQVSIFDLQRLLDSADMKAKNTITPVTTFEPPSGCSFLSFAPNGLNLLTISKKGDQHIVWSLMRMQHPRIDATFDKPSTPYVRQIWQEKRLTVATIVDVVWNTPNGDRFAILTERGTIHIHEIPATAFQWPPLRRARRQREPPKVENKDNNDASGSKTTVSSAVDTLSGTSAWLKSQTLALRSSSIGNSSSLPGVLVTAPATTAYVGGKVVKASFNKGMKLVTNSANTIYHASENKLSIDDLTNGISPGRMHWMSGRDQGSLAVVVSGTLSIYTVRRTTKSQKGQPPLIKAKISKTPVEFVLSRVADQQLLSSLKATMEGRHHNASRPAPPRIGGMWHLRAPAATFGNITNKVTKRDRQVESWHAMFEMESNPPCQPFHTDRRVTVYAYNDPEGEAPTAPKMGTAEPEDWDTYEDNLKDWHDKVLDPWLQKNHHVLLESHGPTFQSLEPWVFGEEIESTQIISGGNGVVSDALLDEDEVENKIHVISGLDGEQVHVTIIRRAGREEEEFFEDGCEVVEFA